jgi:hypothetical protein
MAKRSWCRSFSAVSLRDAVSIRVSICACVTMASPWITAMPCGLWRAFLR